MIWSLRSPDSSASSVDWSADSTMHSLMISSEVRAEIAVRVLLHLRHDELLIEGAAVDADAYRLAMVARHLADRGELLIAPAAGAHVARVDSVFVERSSAVGVPREQEMSVVVKVTDERRRAARVEHPLLDFRHGSGGFGNVHRYAHQLRARLRQLDDLRAVASTSVVSVIVMD